MDIKESEQGWLSSHLEEVVRDCAEILREQPPGREPVSTEEYNRALGEVAAMHNLGLYVQASDVTLSEDGAFPPMQLRTWVARWIGVDRDDLAEIQRTLEINELKQGEAPSDTPWRLVKEEAELREHLSTAQQTISTGLTILARIDAGRADR